jgi:hypothetical protein
MANSSYIDTVFIMDTIYRLSPASVLDVGAGIGRWGFLCRCHIGVGESLQQCPEQPLRIDAVEAFEPNIGLIYKAVYDKTHAGDALEVLPRLGSYDVVICSHMIEHMTKDDGLRLLDAMLARANKALILALPLNDRPRAELRGNPFEAHQSTWTKNDFRGRGVYLKTFPFQGRVKLAVAIFPRSDEARWVVRTLRQPWRRWLIRLLRGRRRQRTADHGSQTRDRAAQWEKRVFHE